MDVSETTGKNSFADSQPLRGGWTQGGLRGMEVVKLPFVKDS